MKKLVIKSGKNKSFFSKKMISISTLSTIVATVPLSAGVCQIVLNNSKYVYKNQSFNSYNELQEYVKSNAKLQKAQEDNNWSITLNGNTKTYSTPEELRNDVLNNYINSNLSLSSNNSSYITRNAASFSSINDSNITSIYQGNHDVAYQNSDDAYKTYFNVKNGYFFNNIYFSTKTELNNYLVSNYLPTANNKTNSIVLKSPSGVESPSIDLSSKDAYQQIEKFISNYSDTTLSYKNSATGKNSLINKTNVNSVLSDVSLSDLDYLHVQSSQGESRYIVDNQSTDEANLIGPYFYNGVLDTGSFMNKKMWKKTNGVKSQVYAQSKIDISIGSFFTSIFNDDNALNLAQAESNKTDAVLFRTLLEDKNGESFDQSFLTELGKLSPKLKAAVVEANTTMMSGKKYNSFYKLSILYNFLLSRIVSWGLGQDVMNLVVNYFTSVANFIQDSLEFVALYNKDLLKSKDGKSLFNVKDFFEIGNPEYNINSSTEYFLNKLKTNYPNLVALSLVYVGAQNNITMAGGLIPFSSFDSSLLFDYGIFDNKDDYYKMEHYLEPVYNVFSSLNTSDMVKIYVGSSGRTDVKALASLSGDELVKKFAELKTGANSNISLELMLSSIGAKNSKYYEMSNSLIKLEINTYLETGTIVKGGYLAQLYSTNPNRDKLGLFINFVNENSENVSLYRAYLAFMMDKRVANNQFIDSNSTSNWTNFGSAISKIGLYLLGSAVQVSTTISKIYNHQSDLSIGWDDEIDGLIPQASSNPIMDMFVKDLVSIPTAVPDSSGNTGQGGNSSGQTGGGSQGGTSSPGAGEGPSTGGSGNSGGSSSNTTTTVVQKEAYSLSTKDAAKKGKILKTPSTTKTSLFDSSVNPSTSAIPEKKVWYITFEDFLNNRLTDASGAQDFYSDIKDAHRLKSIARNANGELMLLNPLDDAMVATSSNFNQLDDLQNQWTTSNNNDSGSTTSKPSSSKYSRPEVESFKKQKKSWWSGTFKSFDKIKNLISIIGSATLGTFTVVFVAMEVFFFIYNLLSETTTQDFYTYTTVDGTEFIWDGGRTVTKYLGLQITQTNGIESMQLLKPVQITLPQVEEYYFFNGIKYYDNTEELKRNQLIYLLNGGEVVNKNFEKSLMFSSSNFDRSSTLSELVSKVVGSLGITKNSDGSFTSDKLNKNSIYLSSINLSSYGVTSSSSQNNYAYLAQSISENIRPTLIVKLPTLVNGYASDSVSDFVFPGNYWENGKVVAQSGEFKNYLVDNSANEIVDSSKSYVDKSNFKVLDANKAVSNAKESLFNTFKNSFNLNTKQILTNDLTRSNKYSNINAVAINKVYTANINGASATFDSLENATNYVLNKLNFSKNLSYEDVYVFENQTFKSINDIMKYVLKNSKVVN
ncbi:hypothetical protein [Malacoplasma penetrans HF-2]|uniref:Uncharacterized protein n=1 Tax=Malacoplasma penetrans (strain HF-2) TaxID=272633 RepID=Q8EW21_MALP2|nr:hypothetical protein [Malacoplasma penetrans]BAC44175.1 hypothetical protein [Malacoplasma penetrans HF-2]